MPDENAHTGAHRPLALARNGDYGNPRPVVIAQTDALPLEHASVVVCQMTWRVTIEPSEKNGLRLRSPVMADKPVTIRRERVGRKIGNLDDTDMLRVNIALAFVMGLTD